MGMEWRLPAMGWFAPVRHLDDVGRCEEMTIAGRSPHGRLQHPLILRRPERILEEPGRELAPDMQASLH
jgi:hypothetical protein